MMREILVLVLISLLLFSPFPLVAASDNDGNRGRRDDDDDDDDDRGARDRRDRDDDDDDRGDRDRRDDGDCLVAAGTRLRVDASGEASKNQWGKGRGQNDRRDENARLTMTLAVERVSAGSLKVDVVEGRIVVGGDSFTLGDGSGELNLRSGKIEINADITNSNSKLRLLGEWERCFEDEDVEVEFERPQSKITGRALWFLDLEGEITIVGAAPPPPPPHRTILSISKDVNATRELGGGTLRYLIRVTNEGNEEARRVNVSDVLPEGVNFVSSNTTIESSQGRNLRFALGTISARGVRAIVLIVRIQDLIPDSSILRNDASVSWINLDGSRGPTASAGARTTIDAPVVRLFKNVNASSTNPGRGLLYSIRLINGGHSRANIRLNDTLPANVTLISSSLAPTLISGRSLVWTFDLASGGSVRINITVSVLSNIMSQMLINNAEARYINAKGITFPTLRAQVSTSVVTPLPQSTLLGLSKKVNATSTLGGAGLAYSISFANRGSSSALAVNITDTLPSYLTFVSTNWSIASFQGKTIKFAIGSVLPGRNNTILIIVRVNGTTPDNLLLKNNATIDWRNQDGSISSARATVQTIVRAPVLSLSKIVNATSVARGRHLLYTIRVNNTGHADAIIHLNDTIASGTSLVSFTFSGPSSSLAISGRSLLWDFTLAPNQTVTITLLVRIGDAAIAPVANEIALNYANQLMVQFPRLAARVETSISS